MNILLPLIFISAISQVGMLLTILALYRYVKIRRDAFFEAEIHAVRARADRLHSDLEKQIDANKRLSEDNLALSEKVISALARMIDNE